MSEPIPLYKVIAQIPGADRPTIVQAIKAGKIKSESTEAPWMVTLEDVQAYVAANPGD